ncbi:MAG TPA: hypothetical protein VIH40_05230 [Xanthobacteraceae bacterium]
MLSLFKRKHRPAGRAAQVGWLLDSDKATVIFDAPRKISRDETISRHAKSVRYCPAVLDHEARHFEVSCPIDVTLRIGKNEKTNESVLINAEGDRSAIRTKQLGQIAVLVSSKEWRHPDRPIVQIQTPYLFIADEPIYVTQLPPFAHYARQPWPGVVIGGRFPIHVWPRTMMWALEWYDTSKDLVLRRGEPWFYVRFETEDPSRPVKLVEAEMTPQLREFANAVSGVTNYVNRTFSLFNTAQARRPQTLVVPKQR